jgi:hypothetical protein
MAEPQNSWGAFPFGQPNTQRPMRLPTRGPAQALVVGVYPSAFHVAWTPPAHLDPREGNVRARPFIRSLAVDVEPKVFWDDSDPAPAEVSASWKTGSQFDDGAHGTVSIGHNGPSGAGLVTKALQPLGLDPSAVAFTDAVPWFFVKGGEGSQGDAMRSRFAPIAEGLEVHPGSLPPRPSSAKLVDVAASEGRRDTLRREVIDAATPVVITLGQEALEAMRRVADGVDGAQERLTPSGYGALRSLTIDGHVYGLLPLVHPGFERQTNNDTWKKALVAWTAQAPTTLH